MVYRATGNVADTELGRDDMVKRVVHGGVGLGGNTVSIYVHSLSVDDVVILKAGKATYKLHVFDNYWVWVSLMDSASLIGGHHSSLWEHVELTLNMCAGTVYRLDRIDDIVDIH